MLSNSDIKVLEKIIDLDGDCLSNMYCSKCPFAQKCLPLFVTRQSPTKEERTAMALDALAKHTLLDDKQEFVRDKDG